jgi:hypothetical protein
MRGLKELRRGRGWWKCAFCVGVCSLCWTWWMDVGAWGEGRVAIWCEDQETLREDLAEKLSKFYKDNTTFFNIDTNKTYSIPTPILERKSIPKVCYLSCSMVSAFHRLSYCVPADSGFVQLNPLYCKQVAFQCAFIFQWHCFPSFFSFGIDFMVECCSGICLRLSSISHTRRLQGMSE